MKKFSNIAVFCGSSDGADKIYCAEAITFGETLADNNIGLVYGGASIGVMGAVANGCLQKNGKVIGVIPEFLCLKEIVHASLTELHIVKTMHERKTMMHELSDGFVIFPGGIGTLEEFFEILTWAQLGLHQKPILIANINGYYSDLIHFIDHMTNQKFLKPIHKKLILVTEKVEDILPTMKNYTAPDLGKFIDEEKT